MRWTVLLPVKASPSAKSRLAATMPPATRTLHAALVAAMRTDVIAAVRATPSVARVVVIADEAGEYGADVTVIQHRRGLNEALREGAGHARAQWPEDGIAALVGDLPALRADELAAALDAAATRARAFVPDAQGTGTTLLTASPADAFEPAFGVGSAARHARIAAGLTTAGTGLRRDVDTAAELAEAVALGVGPATARVWAMMPRSS